jgi:S1-C subfamily serine protease
MRLRVSGLVLVGQLLHSQTTPPPGSPDVLARVSEATAIILAGEGAGRLTSISTGVMVRPGGVLLTSYHALKNAREVQVRLKSGETFDHAVLLGVDERRDVAAIRISAVNLPSLPIGTAQNTKPGEVAYAVTNSNGLTWSATQGIFSATRLADEIPGAGHGYTVLQFTAPVAPGASGGPLADANGNLVGIITRGDTHGAAFAVPVESVAGLADGNLNTPLGDGSALQLPNSERSPSSRAVANADPKQLLRSAKTAIVRTRTSFFTPETLEREFLKQAGYKDLGLVLVQDPRLADLLITIDRPLFTYTFTYAVTDAKTSVLLDTGKVTAIDGNSAAGKIAKELTARLITLRQAANANKSN